jgi:hypothetical protein
MPRRGTRTQLLRDIIALEERFSGDCDEDGNLLWQLPITKPLGKLSTKELQQLAATLGVTPEKVGRPRRYSGPLVEDIEFLMHVHGRGVLDACRRYDREASAMFLKRAPKRSRDEREAAAAALAKRYHREKRRLTSSAE